MSTWVWIVLVIAVVVIVAAAVAWNSTRRRRSEELKAGFGPEYDRTVDRTGDQAAAEAELLARKQRRDELDLQPLSAGMRTGFMTAWHDTQADFVDDPAGAINDADQLIQSVMRERGYPVEDFDERASIVSVDHPLVVERYRRAHAITVANRGGEATTENLRRAMQDYRALFVELVEDTAGEPAVDAHSERVK